MWFLISSVLSSLENLPVAFCLAFCCTEPPVIQTQPGMLDVIVNNPVLLPCEAMGTPQPIITWQKEGINVITAGILWKPVILAYLLELRYFLSLLWIFKFMSKKTIHLNKRKSYFAYICFRQRLRGSSQWQFTDCKINCWRCWYLHVCCSKSSWHCSGEDQTESSR